ncbi:winged helix-turn-helix domain-containing protein [Colidextribacter sp. 210702-DFI.3.9]|uniref:winged helix-turn-helix domain-containing protein n=1 Tax=Clostridia TaxID=186801 RepID=UPI001D095DA6|nr:MULTISPECIES: winged helix-turn-helix domain-containing protein [Eubacteriales]MCB6499318.1 winged helix-turn-helix domain-containing protein [Colidextribacter sp. 210702-DFI.3.9]MCB7361459.1 winged helix-turn-helix domain-containing protein [Flavonifractor plautii]
MGCIISCSIFSRKALVGRYNFGGKALIGLAVLQYDNLCIDPNQRRAFVSGRAVELTTMEFNILYYLALHPGWTFTREQLYQYAMPDDFASGLESVTSRIYKIRKKLNINAIQTVHGYGYRFEK